MRDSRGMEQGEWEDLSRHQNKTYIKNDPNAGDDYLLVLSVSLFLTIKLLVKHQVVT